MEVIRSFSGEHRYLSNFWIEPLKYSGVVWQSAEHAYQAEKTLVGEEREAIFSAHSPGAAKRMGQDCTLRPDWEAVKIAVMRNIVLAKFKSSTELEAKLLATGDTWLIEGNTWGDEYWGQVWAGQHGWRGSNWLGRILMEVRSQLALDKSNP